MSETPYSQPNDILLMLANDYIKEKRRRRRWGIFFKIAFLILIIVSTCLVYFGADVQGSQMNEPHAALIDIRGPIFDESKAKADNIVRSLHAAFKDKGTKGIILRINSPGGSPVQADYVYQEIKRQRQLHPDIKVYAVCVDICASGAYYVASASDKIYANPSSMVGSIGVLFDGFGAVETMHKLGIERRLITAGKNKGFLDPFSPTSPQDVEHLRTMLAKVHETFILSVKAGRGNRLSNDPDIFSGAVWVGTQAKTLGLIDEYGSAGSVARLVIKTDRVVNYTVRENYWAQFAKQFGTELSHIFFSQFDLKLS